MDAAEKTRDFLFEVIILWAESGDICFELVRGVPQGSELTVALFDTPDEATRSVKILDSRLEPSKRRSNDCPKNPFDLRYQPEL